MSAPVEVRFENSDRVQFVTPAKARTMLRPKLLRAEDGKPLLDKNKKPITIPPDAKVVMDKDGEPIKPFTICVKKGAAHRYPRAVRWTASSEGHVMMGAVLMDSPFPLAEKKTR